MGAFFLLHCEAGNVSATDGAARVMQAHMLEAGFGKPVEIAGSNYVFCYFAKIFDPRPQVVHLPDGRFLACVGTIFLGARTGVVALREILAQPDLDTAIGGCRGQYALIAGSGDEVRIIPDACGTLEIFHDHARGIFSTSLLAVARTQPRRVLRRQEAMEYVFHGTSMGDGTLLEGIRRLDFGETVRIAGTVTIERHRAPLPPQATGTREAVAAQTVAELGAMLRDASDAFGGRTTLALSGGYDTRLLLALCRSNGIAPKLFVYGGPDASDVVLARHIAAAEGLPLEHLDKSTIGAQPTPETCADFARRNFLQADGTLYAGLLANDCEELAREARHADGALNLHGAAGEVFRNFFGISSRATTPFAVAQLFYISDPGVCAKPFSDRSYIQRIAQKMANSTGVQASGLDRRAADSFYPYFRCRAWFGKDFSLNSRFGHSLLPFYDAHTVAAALSLPPGFKDFGNFEALMIRLADPALAAHPSAYGHDFSADAPFGPTMRQRVLQQRPAWLRRRMAQARTAASRGSPAGAWPEPWLAEALQLDTPLMRALFDTTAIRHSDLFPIFCNLAYFATALGVTDLVD